MNLKNKDIDEYDISESLKESTKKHLVKGLDVDFVVDHFLSLEDSDNFDLINKLSDLWEVYNESWKKFNKSLSYFWKVMNDIEELDSFDKTCKEIIEAWYDDIEDIFYSDDNFENLKLNYGFKGNDIFESKESIKEEIDRPTWSKWVVNNVHHIEYFFNGKIVDKKMLNSLFESEGFDTDVDTVEDEIKKAVRSVRLGNLDGNALHIAHNSVGNRIDLVFDIGQLMGEVESLSDDECIIRINGDIYEQGEDMWNFGFAIYLTCDIHPLDFALAESKKKSAKPINEKNVAKFVDELNKFCDEKIHYADAERFTKKYGKMYNFKYRFDDTDEIFVVYDSEGTLDMFDDNASYVREEIDRLAKKNDWYAEPYTSSANFTFGEL